MEEIEKDLRYFNQVQVMPKWKGFPNPVKDKPNKYGPVQGVTWRSDSI